MRRRRLAVDREEPRRRLRSMSSIIWCDDRHTLDALLADLNKQPFNG